MMCFWVEAARCRGFPGACKGRCRSSTNKGAACAHRPLFPQRRLSTAAPSRGDCDPAAQRTSSSRSLGSLGASWKPGGCRGHLGSVVPATHHFLLSATAAQDVQLPDGRSALRAGKQRFPGRHTGPWAACLLASAQCVSARARQ